MQSKYKPKPKIVDVHVEIAPFAIAPGETVAVAPVIIPVGKSFSLEGRITGLPEGASLLPTSEVEFRDAKDPKSHYGAARLACTDVGNQQADFSATVMEPFVRACDVEMWFYVTPGKPTIVRAKVIR
ncbi:MAG: hypothetical protein MUF06_08285 [Pirellulaceae bacterium]|nr:hypothetical protein [Pirellulaceae bacterium]